MPSLSAKKKQPQIIMMMEEIPDLFYIQITEQNNIFFPAEAKILFFLSL